MPYQNNIITGAISVGDISSAIGYSSLDVGTLCSYNNINKWAKHKPFEPIYNAQPSYSSSDWVTQAKSANWGLSIPIATTAAQLHSMAGTNSGKWTHVVPTTWYRMLDFQGYCSTTYKNSIWQDGPFGTMLLIRNANPRVGVDQSLCQLWININAPNDYLLYPYDFNGATSDGSAVQGTRVDLSKFYYGLLLKGADTSADKVWIGNTKISSMVSSGAATVWSYDINTPTTASAGSYTLIPIFADGHTNNAWASSASTNATNFIPLEGLSANITISSAASGIVNSMGYMTSQTSSSTTFGIDITNELLESSTTKNITVTGVQCYVISVDTYWDNTYRSGLDDIIDDVVNGADTNPGDKYVNGKVVARYVTVSSTNTAINFGNTNSYPFTIQYTTDGAGNEYTGRIYMLIRYTYRYTNNNGQTVTQTKVDKRGYDWS